MCVIHSHGVINEVSLATGQRVTQHQEHKKDKTVKNL